MAYIKGYTYDVFISYSHIDNEKLVGQTMGWIEQFYTDLNILLWQSIGTKDVSIWWDNSKLDGSVVFDDAIANSIKNSALFICLTSPAYLKSEYCKKELDLFYNKVQQEPLGLRIGERSRIINVLLNNIPYKQWPFELSGTTGFPFHDAVDKEALGDRTDVTLPTFKEQLKDLRDAIVKLIDEILEEEQQKQDEDKEKKFTIYFSDVADSLRTVRKRTITELEKEGYNIVCDVPPPFEKEEHENAVKEKLEDADLSVHLLDQYPGREIEEEETLWYPQRQAELGLLCNKPQMIWVPPEVDFNIIEEDAYKTFMKGLESGEQIPKKIEYIRVTKSELTQQITDLAIHIRKEQLGQTNNGKVAVLLDTHYNDQLYALELSKSLLENEIQPYINPQEDDPHKNMNMLEDRISQVNKLIFFYGKVKKDWVLERMSAALQLIVTNNYPIEDFFVYMVPPHKSPDDISLKQRFLKVNVVNNSDTPQIDANALEQFVKSIKAVA